MAWTGPIESVEFNTNTTGATTLTFQPAATITVGTLIVLAGCMSTTFGTASATAADNSTQAGTANSYSFIAGFTNVGTHSLNGAALFCVATRSILTTNTITLTMTTTSARRSGRMLTFTGSAGSLPMDVFATATMTNPLSMGPTGSLAGANELALGISFWTGGNVLSGVADTAGYTLVSSSGSGGSSPRVETNMSYKTTAGPSAETDRHAFSTATANAGVIVCFVPSSGTNYTKSLSGGLSFHGSTPTGAVQRKLPGGTLSFSGSVAKKQNARLLTASYAPTGALSRAQALGRQLAAAAFHPAGAITSRSVARTFTAGFTPTGALTSLKAFGKSLSASLSFVGSQSHVPAKVLTAGYAPTGSLAEGKTLGRTLTALFSATTRTDVGIIIPAYAYPSPTTVWDGWISGAPNVKMMIADPATGPGVAIDTNYVAAIAHAQANGIRILGYVDTSFGTVDPAIAEGQVDAWFSLYGIRDIFFDNVNSGASFLSYYQALGDYVHAVGGAKVMMNPGTNPDEGYFNGMADIVNTFEGSGVDYASYSPPSFIEKYPSSMVSHLVYDVSSAQQMDATVSGAIRDNAGYVYVTDATLAAFPWATVPAYWAAELAIPYTGFTKAIARKLTASFTPHGQVASSRRGVMSAALSFSGAVTHSLPSRTFTAALTFSGNVTKQTFRTLFGALQASGTLHSHVIPVTTPPPPGGGGFGAVMSSEFFQRYTPTFIQAKFEGRYKSTLRKQR